MGLLYFFFNRRKKNVDWQKGLGLTPSPEDSRDFEYVPTGVNLFPAFPESVELSGWTIKNQGRWNSCTAHAVCTAAEMLNKDVQFSERHNWYYTRKDYMNTFPKNTGVYLRDALKVAQKQGLSPETLCQYDSDLINEVPSKFADGFARFFRIGEYSRVYGSLSIKEALVDGYPVVIGMQVWDEFMSYNGTKPLSLPKVASYRGGHAMVVYGYNAEGFMLLNSWDVNWGIRGTAILPYSIADRVDVLFESYAVTRLKRRDEQ